MSKVETWPSDAPLAPIGADEMRRLEGDVMTSGAVTGLALMERAGEGVVAAIDATWPEQEGFQGRACILCGPGNNGGDGYVIARLLAARGWQVSVVALGDTDRLPPDAKANHGRWAADHPVQDWTAAAAALQGADLVVDALFGIGLTRPLGAEILAAFAAIPKSARRVSVDVPSGLMADSSQLASDPAIFPADLVVTFHAPKPVHLPMAEAGMRVMVADIGL